MLIVPSRKAGQTTANCWVAISGANGESTPKIPIPRNTYEFVFHVSLVFIANHCIYPIIIVNIISLRSIILLVKLCTW